MYGISVFKGNMVDEGLISGLFKLLISAHERKYVALNSEIYWPVYRLQNDLCI